LAGRTDAPDLEGAIGRE